MNPDYIKSSITDPMIPGIKMMPGYSYIPIDMVEDRPVGVSPLEAEFPDMWHKLFDYQRDDVRFFTKVKRGIIAHPCSGRKTLSGIASALGCRSNNNILVIGPAISRTTWESEYRRWVMSENTRFFSLSGKVPVKVALDPKNINIVFVNYEVLAQWGQVLSTYQWGAFLFDEFHEMRGRSSARLVDGMKKILLRHGATPRIGLTATPVWTRLDGLYNMFQIICPGMFGTMTQFKMRYMGGYQGTYGIESTGRLTNEAEFKKRFDYWVRMVEVSGLPEMSRQITYIKDAEVASKATLLASRIAQTEEDAHKAYKAVMEHMSKYTHIKFPHLRERITSGLNVVACQFISSVNSTVKYLSGIKGLKVYSFTGSNSLEERVEIINKASQDEFAVVVCSIGSARQSIDMARFDSIFVIEPPYGAQEAIQFEGRFRRNTRDRVVNVEYIVIEDSPDMRCIDLILAKLETVTKVTGDSASQYWLATLTDNSVDKVLAEMLRKALSNEGV
jgi:hypothetical protein